MKRRTPLHTTQVYFDGEAWVVRLLMAGEIKHWQEFARFDDKQLQLYCYAWCVEGSVVL